MTEYVMSKAMYVDLIKKISKGKKLGNPKAEVIKYLNDTVGVLGEVIDIHIEG